jgi:glycosyltransferase involved in cell wall biosynthesis
MLDVHVLFEHGSDHVPYATSTLRLLRPLTHPSCGKSIKMTSGTSPRGIDTDVIIVDRLWKPDVTLEEAEHLVKYTRSKDITLIYALDDNLLDLGNDLPSPKQPLTPIEKNIVRYFIREASGVIVTTEPLYNRVKHLNDNIIISPNVLDERLITKKDPVNNVLGKHVMGSPNVTQQQERTLVLGYMGTPSHDRDFSEILPALKYILQKYHGKLRFEVVGSLSDKRLLQALPGTTQLDPNGHVEYTRFWPWMKKNIHWDIAIAPLEKSEFTKCKSDLKFLDYTALGIPAIYTRFAPYEFTVNSGKTGLLVQNETDEWVHALELLINDADLRFNIVKDAYEYLFTKRVLKNCSGGLKDAIFSLYKH